MTAKENFLREFNRAFSENNISFIRAHVSEDIVWNMTGNRIIQGEEAFSAALETMESEDKFDLEIKHIITHGKIACVHGAMHSSDKTTYAFCDIYVFSNFKDLKIKELTSFVIQIKTQ